jgi:TonB family protein
MKILLNLLLCFTLIATGLAQNKAPKWDKEAPPSKKEGGVKKPSADDEIFTIVEQNPEFPDGQAALFKWLSQNIKYPAIARANEIEGTIYVGFIVNKNGSISNAEVKRGVAGSGLNEEALRVINAMPRWKPGKNQGKPVRVAYTLPIMFKLTDAVVEPPINVEVVDMTTASRTVELAPPPPMPENVPEKPVGEPIFTIVEESPEFPDGQAAQFKWLAQNLKYPAIARENQIEGTVYVGFVVNKDGSLEDLVVKRGIGGGCNEEAIRLIGAMPLWKPGKQQGQVVRVAYTLPIKFKLE